MNTMPESPLSALLPPKPLQEALNEWLQGSLALQRASGRLLRAEKAVLKACGPPSPDNSADSLVRGSRRIAQSAKELHRILDSARRKASLLQSGSRKSSPHGRKSRRPRSGESSMKLFIKPTSVPKVLPSASRSEAGGVKKPNSHRPTFFARKHLFLP
ncbi:hypothetical protein SAMN05880555_2718 [Paenibacillus sp. RU4X]|nr:hypothetical protein SAMN05880555_2718 [Paenibacillus sp. RU4X]